MNRTREQWRNCVPSMMAENQSLNATRFAIEDAKADILELYRQRDALCLQIEKLIDSALNDTGHEPSVSVLHRDIDESRAMIAGFVGVVS